MRRLRGFDAAVTRAARGGAGAKPPLGARLALIVALGLACWALPILIFYLR